MHVTDRIKRAKRALGGSSTWGHVPPGKNFDFRPEIAFGAVLGWNSESRTTNWLVLAVVYVVTFAQTY